MWQSIGSFTIRNRFWLLVSLVILVFFFLFFALRVKLTYDFAKVIPTSDPDYVDYMAFKNTFGEDGNILAIGFQSDKLFEKDFFNQFLHLNTTLKSIQGVERVVSPAELYRLRLNSESGMLELNKLTDAPLKTQADADSLRLMLKNMPFYNGLIYNDSSRVALIAITLQKQVLDSKERIALVKKIEDHCHAFGETTHTEMHYSGLPYVRTVYSSKVADEIKIFTYLAIFITAVFIFLFFRFYSAVLYSLIVVVIGVICTLGSIELMGYRITLLTGLIPPLIVIIGIQNCIYLLNVYHQEFRAHGNKMLGIIRLISKNGLPLFLTNVTTAVGFLVFSFSGSVVLDQFAWIAGFNIMLIYAISLVFIPIVYSYLPPPTEKHVKHLDSVRLNRVMDICYTWVHTKRVWIYTSVVLISLVSLLGTFKVKTLGYVIDDLPVHDKVYTDLKFFETHLKGVLPYEIIIDTKRINGVKDLVTLQKINRLQKELAKFPEFSKSVSLVDFIKFANQGYNNGDVRHYIIPGLLEIEDMLSSMPKSQTAGGGLLKSMVDSTYSKARISIQMADVGSVEMKRLNNQVNEKLTEIFPQEKYASRITGTSLIFLKGNDYLVSNLLSSMISALIIISLMMALLFFSWKMVLIALLPNIIPLLMTLGIMGYFDIRLKPSTIIIFSVAYGIVVDFTIHYLAKYRNSLKKHDWNMSAAIPESMREAGPSIIYTAVALFFGFIIFAASDFGGTIALGVLTSLSLLFGMLMNLLLLPSLLVSLEKAINSKKELQNAWVQMEPEPLDTDENQE
ncbi:MAG: efflux RND transporter permease subunit [Bacteroidota bacterium]